ATIAEIAEEAGVSQGLPYRYFRSKRALFRALFEGVLRTQSESALRAQSMEGSPGERFERIVTNMVDLRRMSPELSQLFHEGMDRALLPARLRQDLLQHGLRVRTQLRRLIVEGHASGEIVEGDPDQLLVALLATLDGLSRVGWVRSPSGAVAFPEARIVLRMFLREGRHS
ncbi:MAG: TetR/AcrR family transcriptional regulator, partial [Thermoplasmata archaeon]